MIIARWKTGTGPVPRWVDRAAEEGTLVYGRGDMVVRSALDEDVAVRRGDTLCLMRSGEITVEQHP